jgi:cytochrome c oxidase subunit 2
VRVGNVSGVIDGEAPRASVRDTVQAGTPSGRRGRLAAGLATVAGGLLLAGCNVPTFGEFRGATSQGHDEFKLWVGMFIAGLVVAAVVWGLIFWTVIFHRRRRLGDQLPRQFHEHIPLEIVYTIIPVLIVVGIFVATVITENEVDALPRPDLVVNVTAFQWGWEFQYQGKNVTIVTSEQQALALRAGNPSDPAYPRLVLPEGENTQIVLQSNDVAHSMWVPAFNFSRMALPGVVNKFTFTPTELGVFDGRCNQYCGLYHSEMLFSVQVVTPSQFQQFIASQQSSGGNR